MNHSVCKYGQLMTFSLKLLLVVSHYDSSGMVVIAQWIAMGVVGLDLGHAVGFIMVPLTTLLGAQHYV